MAEITRIFDFLNMHPLSTLLLYPLKSSRLRIGKGSTSPKTLIGIQSLTGAAKSHDAYIAGGSLESLHPKN